MVDMPLSSPVLVVGAAVPVNQLSAAVPTISGTMVRLGSDGLFLGNTELRYATIFYSLDKVCERFKNGNEDVAGRFKRMRQDIETNGTYADFLRFGLLASFADDTAGSFLQTLARWEPQSLIGNVNGHFARIFPDAPPLPTENGVWTEIVRLNKKFQEGKLNVNQLMDMLKLHVLCLRDKIKISEDGVEMGPLVFTAAEIVEVFRGSVEVQIKKLSSAIHRKDKEEANKALIPNRRAKVWLERGDIDKRTKSRLALAYLCFSGSATEDFVDLFAGDFAQRPQAEAEIEVGRLYSKYVEGKKEETKEAPTATGSCVAQFKYPPTEWKLLSYSEMCKKYPDERKPDISYTIFRRLGWVLSFTKAHGGPEDNEFLKIGKFILKCIAAKTFDYNTRAMILDLSYQALNFKPRVFREIHAILTQNEGRPEAVSSMIGELYRKEVYYADALFRKLNAEKAADSKKAAKKLLMTMAGEGQTVALAWRKALENTPTRKIKERLLDVMERAIYFTQNDPLVYRPWILYLGELSKDTKDWQWLQTSATSPERTVRALQDMTYPPQGVAIPARPAKNALGFELDDALWQTLCKATAFFTPEEWDYFTMRFTQMREDISQLVSAGDSESFQMRQYLLQIEPFSRDTELAKALQYLSAILSGRIGNEAAITVRDLLRDDALFDPAMFYSILRLAHLYANNFASKAMEALNIIGRLKKMGVEGDYAGIAVNIAFAPGGARNHTPEWRSAMAKYETIVSYVKRGCRVKILQPDIEMEMKTPDILATPENPNLENAKLIKVKAKLWNERDLDKIKLSIIDASLQLLNSRHNEGEKTIVLQLVIPSNAAGADIAPAIDVIKKLLADPGGKAVEAIEAVEVFYIDEETREMISFERVEKGDQAS